MPQNERVRPLQDAQQEVQTREEQGREAESQMAEQLTTYFSQDETPRKEVTEEVEDDEIVGDTPPKTKAGEIEEEDSEEEEEGSEEEEPDEETALLLDGKPITLDKLLENLTFNPVVNGEEMEVGYQELINGYQRQADYDNHARELKEAKQQIIPILNVAARLQEDPSFQEYVGQYLQSGGMPNDPLLQISDNELDHMLDEDSPRYDREKAQQVIRARSRYRKDAQEREEVSRRTQERHQRELQDWMSAQVSMAKQSIDGAHGEGTYERISPLALDILKEKGFTDQEIAMPMDNRFAQIIAEAAMYRESRKKGTAPRASLGGKKVKLSPPKPTGKSSGKREPSAKRKLRDSAQLASRTQRSEDWAKVALQRVKSLNI